MLSQGNSGIHFDLYYRVINETNQNEQLARVKVSNWDTIHFLSEILVYTSVDKSKLFGQKVTYLPRFFKNLNEIKQVVHDLDYLSFNINNEQIEPN